MKSGARIDIEGRSFENVQGIFVAPFIDIFGLTLAADKPIPDEVRSFLAKKGIEVQQIVEDGDQLVRLSGTFKVSREELAKFQSDIARKGPAPAKDAASATQAQAQAPAARAIKAPAEPTMKRKGKGTKEPKTDDTASAAAGAKADGGAEAKTGADAKPGADADKGIDAKYAGDKTTASREGKATQEGLQAAHYQRQLEGVLEDYRELSSCALVPIHQLYFQISNSPVRLGPDGKLANAQIPVPPGQNIMLQPEALSEQQAKAPGQQAKASLAAVSPDIRLSNQTIIVDLTNAIIINAPEGEAQVSATFGQEVIHQAGSLRIQKKVGLLSEFTGGMVEITAKKGIKLRNCLFQTATAIRLRTDGDIIVAREHDGRWDNQPKHIRSLTPRFQAFKAADQLLADLSKGNATAPARPAPAPDPTASASAAAGADAAAAGGAGAVAARRTG